MKKIPRPLPLPTPAEIDLAKTDADARKRVRNQMLRVRRRDEEIARLNAENADAHVYGDDGDLGDNYNDDPVIRYVCLLLVLADVLPCAASCAPVLASRIAISGLLRVRTTQHTGM